MFTYSPHIRLIATPLGMEKRIQAIKDIRAATGFGLKDAKELFDKTTGHFYNETTGPARPVFLYAGQVDRHIENVHLDLSKSPYVDVKMIGSYDEPQDTPAPTLAYEASLVALMLLAQANDPVPAISIGAVLKTTRQFADFTGDPTLRAAADLLDTAHKRATVPQDDSLFATAHIPYA